MPGVYLLGPVSVSSLGYFLPVGYFSKTYHYSLPLSLGELHIQEYFKKKRGRERGLFIKPYQAKAGREYQRKKMRVTVQAKLVVGFWELIPMESGSDNSAE